jgi:hypothetical protein
MVMGLHSMEAPLKVPCEKSNKPDDAIKSSVIFFGRYLHHIKINESLLACSMPLKAELDAKKRNATKPDPYYDHKVISTDLNLKQLYGLKKLIKLAQKKPQSNCFSKTQKSLIRKYKISPLYELLPEEEIQDLPIEAKKPSLLQKMVHFLNKPVINDQPNNRCLNFSKPKAKRLQTTICTVLTYGFKSPNKDKNALIQEGKVFCSYEALIFRAICQNDLLSLRKILTPIPFTLNAYTDAFEGVKTRFNISKRKDVFSSAANISPSIFKYLVEQCSADASWKDNSLFSIKCSLYSTLNLMRYLVAYCNLDPCEPGKWGYNALHNVFTQKEFNEGVADYFVKECGVDPSIQGDGGANCLHLAAYYECNAGIKYLIKKSKMDPNTRNVYGKTPLHFAAKEGNFYSVKLLVKYGATITLKDNQGESPIHIAEDFARKEIEDYLLVRHEKYLKCAENKTKCLICLENIKSFKKNKRSFLLCCYQFVCKDDIKKLEECPLCKEPLLVRYVF